MNGCFVHIQGGKMCGIKTTGHLQFDTDIVLNWFKLLLSNPSLTLRISRTKSIYVWSNDFNAGLSVGCLSTQSLMHDLACHLIKEAVFEDINNIYDLVTRGKIPCLLDQYLFTLVWGITRIHINFLYLDA